MPPADYSSIQKSRRIYGTGPQSAHLWWPAVANLQAASMPIAMGQTDGRTDGRIARSHNAPYRMAGHDKLTTAPACILACLLHAVRKMRARSIAYFYQSKIVGRLVSRCHYRLAPIILRERCANGINGRVVPSDRRVGPVSRSLPLISSAAGY